MPASARLGTAIIITTTAVIVSGAAAGQASSRCSSGYLCEWINDDHLGAPVAFGGDAVDYNTVSFDGTRTSVNDDTSSLGNYGTLCNVRVFEHTRFGGAGLTFSYPAAGGYTRDPDLTNGGPGTTANWDNRLSSHDFCR